MSLMNDRIRKGAKPHVYLRPWRHYIQKTVNPTLNAPAMADRLGIERESYLRLERQPHTLSVAELVQIAEAFGIDHWRLWQPPPEIGQKPRVSLDAVVADEPDAQVEGFADMLRRAVGKA
jgi:hypothetical protein